MGQDLIGNSDQPWHPAYQDRARHDKEREEEIERLRQIIREYARHNEGCSAAHGDQYRCRCGWREIEGEFE